MKGIINQIQTRKVDYHKIFSDNNIEINNNPCDLVICIGTKGRHKYLKKTIETINKARENTSLNIEIVVVESDKEPSIEIEEDKIFIDLKTTSTEGMYSRALIANIGFLYRATNAKWFMYHDSDLIMDEFFFSHIDRCLKNNPMWLQPYFGRRVINLSKETTDRLFSGENVNFTDRTFWANTQNKAGAPGGSIIVRNDIFKNVGGFDPEIFYGYAPEDSMFWVKLECCVKSIGAIRECHQGGAMYADSEDMNLYHLFHTNEKSNNPHHQKMHDLLVEFWSCDYKQKLYIIEMKSKILEKYYVDN
jgi:hypothetical protein